MISPLRVTPVVPVLVECDDCLEAIEITDDPGAVLDVAECIAAGRRLGAILCATCRAPLLNGDDTP